MTMIQAHRRQKTYTHVFPDVTLVFEPNELGHVVCDVADQYAVDRLLQTPTGFRLYGAAEVEPPPRHRYLLADDGMNTVDLRTMDDKALRAFAKINGIALPAAANGDEARDAIVAHLAAAE